MKKVLILTLAMMMVCLSVPALAATPSKTVNDTTTTTTTTTTTATVVTVAPTTEKVEAVIAALTEAAKAGSVVESFDADTQAAVAALLPADTDLTKLAINEVIPVAITSFDATAATVQVAITTPTVYADGQAIAALVGIIDGENTTWYAQAAEVVNGQVVVTFTQDVLQLMSTNEAVVAIVG